MASSKKKTITAWAVVTNYGLALNYFSTKLEALEEIAMSEDDMAEEDLPLRIIKLSGSFLPKKKSV